MQDHSPEHKDRNAPIRPWILGALAVALAGGTAALWSSSGSVLHEAVGDRGGDLDADGLPDVLEMRLGSSPTSSDSDGDGISDAEEIARHSDPTDATWLPGPAPVAINLVPYVENGTTHLVTILYAQDGNLATKPFSMGARIGQKLRTAPLTYFTKNATFSSHMGKVAGSSLYIIDSPLDPTLLERFDSISFFSLISSNGKKVDAGVTDLALIDGIVVEYTAGSVLAAASGGAGGPSQAASSFYGPVDADSILEWTPGEICGQVTAVAATMGAVVVEEVVDAACEPGWDSYCDPGCAATVGDTLQRIDPVALING
jgi:hypothetical protein